MLALAVALLAVPPAEVRAALERALPPLVAGAAGHVEQKTCFACHNQTFPVLAFAAARSRGVAVADHVLAAQPGGHSAPSPPATCPATTDPRPATLGAPLPR